MRYEDWDVLLFPKGSKIPMKEFKTNCHVVQDAEFPYTQGSYGLPTMTCFMPGLRPGTPFNISLHCWQTPEVSHFTKNRFSAHLDLVKFEARVLIDGRLVASSSFSCTGPWPQLLNNSFDFTKDGELEPLKFPRFRSELLRQSYWNPADELGRIKIIISEGFPRDSLSVPIERVKNIVAFSFQHAPIDILESSGIAWPNPAMWRRGTFNPSMPVPTQHPKEGAEVHLHSPRRQSSYNKTTTTSSSGHASGIPGLTSVNASTSTILSSMPNTQALLQRGWSGSGTSYNDPFSHQNPDPLSYLDWSNNPEPIGYNQSAADQGRSSYNPATTRKNPSDRRIMTNSDISMPDFGLVNPNALQSVPEPLNFTGNGLDDPDIRTQGPTVPTNTPTTMGFVDDLGIDVNKMGTPGSTSAFARPYDIAPFAPYRPQQSITTAAETNRQSAIDTPPTSEFFGTNSQISSELATSLTHSLLNQPHPLPVHAANIPLPASEIKSRKENRRGHAGSVDNTPTIEHLNMRKVSQSAFSNLSKDGTDNGNNNSPSGSRTFSGVFSQRSVSAGEFGHDLTNINNATKSNSDPNRTNSNPDGFTGSTQGSGNDTKRARHLTPVSSKVINDADEPRRVSPRIRMFEEGN
ncbi:hypothetical protein DL766_010292 [Monosporascus sp. MC13-8B]|uniref:NADH:ubiquinone oxidoreductase intermediate-associated protein 30 domain-containing protein n=1 Tax=Monosporascus cannonballus TaxID=155416 RepID=A0ABY0HFA3_9PEZI|nr:hypothetical protein DL762_001780 [Monosporascus cannonballus]RYP02549.1 hypothetical protein DL766_010292 [Monosporascus sp. MC13-8B]